MEGTQVTIYRNNTELSVFTNSDLSKSKNPFASITVFDGKLGSKEVFWDNIEYFKYLTNDNIESIVVELVEAGQYYSGVIDDIEYLVDRMQNQLKLM